MGERLRQRFSVCKRCHLLRKVTSRRFFEMSLAPASRMTPQKTGAPGKPRIAEVAPTWQKRKMSAYIRAS